MLYNFGGFHKRVYHRLDCNMITDKICDVLTDKKRGETTMISINLVNQSHFLKFSCSSQIILFP